jgi:4-hydroxybenzoate polyprenyltransferase
MSWFLRCGSHLVRHRLLEVAVLQGSPALGVVLALAGFQPERLPEIALLLLGSTLLVAHIFSFNDWSDAALDAEAPRKAESSYLLRGITRRQMLFFSALLGVAALAVLALLPLPVPLFGAAVLVSGVAYSSPGFGLKRVVLLSSLIHVAGQGLHFLMGFTLVAPLDGRALRLALFFALVFTAGHLNQEVRDHDGDRQSGIRTNAVVFGKRPAFLASGGLFALAFGWLAWLAWRGDLPAYAAWLAGLFAAYAAAFGRAVAAGITFESVTWLQRIYRGVFAVIGVVLIALQVGSVWPRPAGPPPPDDPFRMAGRCPWFDAGKLNVQWTFYLVTDDSQLVYVGFAPRLHDPEGRAFAGVNLVVLDQGREVLNLWNRHPIEAATVADTDLDASIGPNRAWKTSDGGRARYHVHLELDDAGRPVTLEATMAPTVTSCRPGGFQLLSLEKPGNHFEYEVPFPGSGLSGSLVAGGRVIDLSGSGYLESIRWLSSPMVRPSRWFWGYLHSGPYTVLFFEPEDYPGARGLLLLSDGATCVAAIEDGPPRVTPPTGGSPEVRVEYTGGDLSLELVIDARKPSGSGFPIFLAPYEIELRRGETSHAGSGIMVFEIGQWSSF